MFCMLKTGKFILSMFQNKTQSLKRSYSFNDLKRGRMAFSCNKKIICILRGITSKHDGDFYCLNCLHSFRTKNNLESHRKVCENKDCHAMF